MSSFKTVKRWVRRAGHHLGVMKDWEQVYRIEKGTEQPAEWYDNKFQTTPSFQAEYYLSNYYFLWSVIADRIVSSGIANVLDIGCGPGQFAALLREWGIVNYTGLDFSETAIDLARRQAPEFQFIVGDVHTSDVFTQVPHDVIVCTEVLEHLEDDRGIISRFGTSKRCLCSVPSFPDPSHVRFFSSAAEVRTRYQPFFEALNVRCFRAATYENSRFFLLDGIRNAHCEVA